MDSKLLRDLVDPIKGPQAYQKILHRDKLRERIWWAQERILAPARYSPDDPRFKEAFKVRGA